MSMLRRPVTLLVTLATTTALTMTVQPVAGAADPAGYLFQTEWQSAGDFDQGPIDLAIAPDGRIYVLAESSTPTKSRVQVYDAAGTLLQTWPDIDHDDPMGIAIGPGGQVHVTDMFGEQFSIPPVPPSVKVYDTSGTFLRQYGLPGDANVWSAGGIALTADGTSYVTDPAYGRIHKFAADGGHVASFGSAGGAAGQFDWPLDIDIAPNGNLVIADTDNARIQVLDQHTGAVVALWGQLGTGPGQFDQKTQAVEVRSDGHIYVGDHSDHVKVFTPAGAYVGAVRSGSVLAGPPTFAIDSPTGIAFGPDQAMYVSGSFTYTRYGVARYVPVGPKDDGKKDGASGTGKAKVAKGTVRLTKGKLRLRVSCAKKSGRCTGKVTVKVKGTRVTKPKKYAIKPGKKKTIAVKVTKKGRKKLRKKRTTRAVATVHGGRTKIRIRR